MPMSMPHVAAIAMWFEFQMQPRLELTVLEQMHGAVTATSRPQLSCEEWDGMEQDGQNCRGRLSKES